MKIERSLLRGGPQVLRYAGGATAPFILGGWHDLLFRRLYTSERVGRVERLQVESGESL